MKVEVSREIDNLTTSMIIDDELTDVDVDDEMLHIYVNVGGENADNIGSVHLTKDEVMQIVQKFQEVQSQVKTTAELEGPDEPTSEM